MMRLRKSLRILAVLACAAGGMAQAPALIHAPVLAFTPDHASGLYNPGETVGWTVRAPLGMGSARFDYTIARNNLTVIQSGTLDLASGIARLETRLDAPGMVYVRLTPAVPPPPGSPGLIEATREQLDKLTLGAAVAPLDFKPGAPPPADFDAFWAAKRAALARVPIHPVLAPAPAGRPGVTLSTVTLDSLHSHVHGYLAAPARKGKFPALVIFQYAGVYPLEKSTVTDRAAEGWLAFDVDAHDMAPGEATAPRDYARIGNADRETCYFLEMYLRDTRALDYIESRPDWDGRTIVLMGTSMGGQQSLVTAGLNPGRVTALIVNVPAGIEMSGDLYGHKSGYPYWPVDDPKVVETARYFDPVNFAPKIRASTLVAFGLIDTTSPPYGVLAAFDEIPAPKEAVPMPESDHNNITPTKQGAYYERAREALDELRETGRFLPRTGWAKP